MNKVLEINGNGFRQERTVEGKRLSDEGTVRLGQTDHTNSTVRLATRGFAASRFLKATCGIQETLWAGFGL